ncbi:Tubulin-tyrosine ligase family protein [Tritrichomonas foetus]|uniref:Tubulin--tyrosine ligase-like protein 5 n=1 Tax=Tritrichomonas foetus TaxID=1144522 RepID=A0A1J4K572_9EUKA|nr:Tubulin-tyrosine ligase family protein [Tritrichomonas foetus]|eukprot:OHT04822.1 Tubulin-tyrosine ligase family protein [Tritrichomonas foetus]
MYKLEEFVSLFNSIPLPYKVIQIPKYGLPPAQLDFSPGVFKHLMKTDDLSIDCLTNSGFHVESNAMISHILIGRRFTQEKINTLNDFQKCSHFYGTHLIGAKDGFNYRMKELQQRLGYPAPFYPLCLFPPDDYEELLKIWPTKPYWIIKAPALSRAREIRLASSKDEEAPKLPFIIEEYISPPYLITGRKFDVRFYALVTSINPLIIYYHHHGLVLFATHQYNDKIENIKDLKIHLTNYEVNKDSETYIKSDDLTEKVENSKWSLPFLWNYFESIGIDSKKLKKEMEDASTAAIIAGMCSLRNLHNSNIKFHRKSSFELLGIDILLDQNLKPYILEINISPSMQASSELDRMMKGELLHDTLQYSANASSLLTESK